MSFCKKYCFHNTTRIKIFFFGNGVKFVYLRDLLKMSHFFLLWQICFCLSLLYFNNLWNEIISHMNSSFVPVQQWSLIFALFIVSAAADGAEGDLRSAGLSWAVSSFHPHLIYTTADEMLTRQRSEPEEDDATERRENHDCYRNVKKWQGGKKKRLSLRGVIDAIL